MPKYSYKVVDSRGSVKSGVLEAADRAQAERELVSSELKIQHLEMMRDPKSAQSLETQQMKRPEGLTRPNPTAKTRPEPPSGPMPRSEPPSGSTPRPEPSPARSKGESPSGPTQRPRIEAPPSGETPRPNRQGANLSPTAPARPVGSPPNTLAPPTSRHSEPAGGSLAPPASPARAFEPTPPPEAPSPAREVQLARPLLALAMCALLLAYLGWAAFLGPPPVPQTAVAVEVRRHPVLISGSLPELPPQATVIFSFPDVSVVIEKPLSELNPSGDGKFSISLEVASVQSPQTFEIRTRCPGQPDLRSRSLSLSLSGEAELSGRLTGELTPEKKQL